MRLCAALVQLKWPSVKVKSMSLYPRSVLYPLSLLSVSRLMIIIEDPQLPEVKTPITLMQSVDITHVSRVE